MKKFFTLKGLSPFSFSCLLLLVFVVLSSSCKKFLPREQVLKHFTQENLVDNNHGYNALHTDSTLINAWGITFTSNGIAWVNSQGGGVSEIYDKEGTMLRAPVWVPGAAPKMPGNPTGVVVNASTDFLLSNGAAARFMFVGLDGILSGWNSDAADNALVIKDNSATAVYTGLTISKDISSNYIYAANFKAGKIDTWDKNFNKVSWTFKDPGIPSGYAPFNIQAIGSWLYVLYAKVGADGEEEKGAGMGYVSIFKTDGTFVKRFASNGALNAPWGIALAPAEFFKDNEDDMFEKALNGELEDMILVGNFGDGLINVYTQDGVLVGPLKSRGKPIWIDGLWAISFPPSTATAVDPNRLYFAAGPNDEKDGLFGYILKQ